MPRATGWVKAIFGRVPMGHTEAAVLVSAGGIVDLTVWLAGLVPKANDPLLLWLLWWVVLTTSTALLVRGLVALGGMIIAGMLRPVRNVVGRLPFEVRSPVTRRYSAPLAPRPTAARGIFDFEADAENAMKQSTVLLKAMVKETQRIGTTFADSSARLPALINASGETKRRELSAMGDRIDKHAMKMEELEAALRADVDTMSENYLKRIPYYGDDAKPELRQIFTTLRDSTAGARQGTVGMRGTVLDLRNQNHGQGIQQSINRATERLADVLGKVVSDFDAVTRFLNQALRLLDDKPQPVTPRQRRPRRR